MPREKKFQDVYKWWVCVLLLFVCWGWRARKSGFFLCFWRKHVCKIMSHLLFPEDILMSGGSQSSSVPFVSSCSGFTHFMPSRIPLQILTFLKLFSQYGTDSFTSSITLWSPDRSFFLGHISCQRFSYICHSKKMVSPHTCPVKQSQPPTTNRNWQGKEKCFGLLLSGTQTSMILQ